MLTQEAKERLRKMLLDMRLETLDQMRAHNQAARERDYTGDMLDWTRADKTVELACVQSERLRERIFSIDEALKAIDTDEYGICDDCEEPINQKRLLLMPFTRHCVSCQSKIEKQAKLQEHVGIKSWPHSKAV